MKKGTIVVLLKEILDNKPGAIGVCYDSYTISNKYTKGLSFIFQNGEYDGFSTLEQNEFLYPVDFSEKVGVYNFVNVFKLMGDFAEIKGYSLSPSAYINNIYKRKIREFKIKSIIE